MKVIFLFSFFLVLSACKNYNSTDDANQALSFLEYLVSGDLKKCKEYLNVNKSEYQLDVSLNDYRYFIITEFGSKVEFKPLKIYYYTKAEKRKWKKDHLHSSLEVLVQISNAVKFSSFKIAFDDKGKIVSLDVLAHPYLIDDNKNIWHIGIPIMIIVLGFNVYVAIQVLKSDVVRKWFKIILLIFVNIPVVGYNAFSGFFIKLFSIQVLGVGFSDDNYFDTYWSIGIPLAAIVIFWKLKNGLYRLKEDNWQ